MSQSPIEKELLESDTFLLEIEGQPTLILLVDQIIDLGSRLIITAFETSTKSIDTAVNYLLELPIKADLKDFKKGEIVGYQQLLITLKHNEIAVLRKPGNKQLVKVLEFEIISREIFDVREE